MQEISWSELTKNTVFISDLQGPNEVILEGKKTIMGRYAVWSPVKGGERHMPIEVSDDLAYLQKKYNVPDDMVFIFLNR